MSYAVAPFPAGSSALNITADLRPAGADLSEYWLVIVPSLFSASDDAVAALTAHVERGGHLVLAFFSGIAGDDGAVVPGGHPGAFRDLAGIVVDEFWPLTPGPITPLEWADGTPAGHGTSPAAVPLPGRSVTLAPRDVQVLDA